MHFAIIENEEYSLQNLLNMILRLRPDWKCIFTAETAEESIRWFNSNSQIDLVFMDIELDDGSCFDIFEQTTLNVSIIFTTSYSEYALKAFKVNSVDYLLKPIDETELLSAIEKFEYNHKATTIVNNNIDSANQTPIKHQKRFLVNHGNAYSFIPIENIAWFESDEKYVFIITKDGKRLLTDIKSLAEIMKVLNSEEFFQLSRGMITSINAISKVLKQFKGRLTVTVSAGPITQQETVSAARRIQFLEWLGQL